MKRRLGGILIAALCATQAHAVDITISVTPQEMARLQKAVARLNGSRAPGQNISATPEQVKDHIVTQLRRIVTETERQDAQATLPAPAAFDPK